MTNKVHYAVKSVQSNGFYTLEGLTLVVRNWFLRFVGFSHDVTAQKGVKQSMSCKGY